MDRFFSGQSVWGSSNRVLRMRSFDNTTRHLFTFKRLVKRAPVEKLQYERLPVGASCFDPVATPDEIGDERKRVTVSEQETLEKISFLKGLRPAKVLVGYYGGSGRKARYYGFVFETNGEQIAVVSADRTRNADYLFRASHPEWETLLEQSKSDVLKSGHPAFIGRVIHQGEWRERITRHLQ